MNYIISFSLSLFVPLSVYSAVENSDVNNKEVIMKATMTQLKIDSPAFSHNQPIPSKYTCDGEDVSPELSIDQIPVNTKSLAIIVDDPDAPNGTFDHFIAWNIAPSTKLPEGLDVANSGKNHFGEMGYRGPCPPKGAAHYYHFKIYALDTMLSLPNGAGKKQLESAMENHIIGKGELIGTYQRKGLNSRN